MSPEDWDACSWDLQRAYWEGFVEEKLVTTGEGEEGGEDHGQQDERQPMEQIAQRTVDTGPGVIDLAAMRDQLAAAR
jgi:hypothetical protein